MYAFTLIMVENYPWHYPWRVQCSSTHPDIICKESVLWNFAKFTGKHLCWSFFFIKVAEPDDAEPGEPAVLLMYLFFYEFMYLCFPMNFKKLLITTFCAENSRWLLLKHISKKKKKKKKMTERVMSLSVNKKS